MERCHLKDSIEDISQSKQTLDDVITDDQTIQKIKKNNGWNDTVVIGEGREIGFETVNTKEDLEDIIDELRK